MDCQVKFTFEDYKVINADNKKKHKYEWQETLEELKELEEVFLGQQTVKEEQEIL